MNSKTSVVTVIMTLILVVLTIWGIILLLTWLARVA